MILLIEGSKPFMDALKTFPENFKFRLCDNWRVTIRGGERVGKRRSGAGPDDSADLELSEFLKSMVMDSTAEEMMEKSKSSMNFERDA